MENATQVVTTATPVGPVMAVQANSAVAAKPRRNTIPKLTAAEASKIPGAIAPVVKKKEMALIYSILFAFPGTGKTWSAVEGTKVHDFASQADKEATAKGLGGVTSVALADDKFEVTLALFVDAKPISNADPANRLLVELEDFLGTVQGTPYKIKVNGTTIAPGVVVASSNAAA
ncbi:MAG TPA: hypothetical protein VMV88_08795 [Gallionella sp.]|nr:hypothetical protein [Gallionella sp.]